MFTLRPLPCECAHPPLARAQGFLARNPMPIIRLSLGALLSSPALDGRLMTALQVLQGKRWAKCSDFRLRLRIGFLWGGRSSQGHSPLRVRYCFHRRSFADHTYLSHRTLALSRSQTPWRGLALTRSTRAESGTAVAAQSGVQREHGSSGGSGSVPCTPSTGLKVPIGSEGPR